MFDFSKTSYTEFVLARNEFLRLVGGPTESLRLITIYFTFEYTFRIKKNVARVTSEQKLSYKGSIWVKLVIRTLF